jgi:hypothetical protein
MCPRFQYAEKSSGLKFVMKSGNVSGMPVLWMPGVFG